MRIVLDLQAAQGESRFRGLGRYTLELAKALVIQAQDHEVFLILNRSFPDTLDPLREVFKNRLPSDHIQLFSIPSSPAHLNSKKSTNQTLAKKLREYFINNLSPDIVHISSLFEGWGDSVVTSIGELGYAPMTTVTLHDLIPLIHAKDYFSDPQYKQFYYKKLHYLKRAHLLFTVSSSTQQEAIDYLSIAKNRMITCYPGVNPQFKPLSITDQDRLTLKQDFSIHRSFILYVSKFEFRKNIDQLIQSFSMLSIPLRKQYQLVLVGLYSETFHFHIQQLKKKCQLDQDELILTGYISNPQLVLLYNLCHLFVFPSLHEGFGLPALEAMACGAIVIGANNSSLPEVIAHPNALFNTTQTSHITNKMQEALTSPILRHQLHIQGLQQAQKFTWEATAAKMLDAFVELYQTKQNQRHPTLSLSMATPLKKMAFVSLLPPQKTGVTDYSLQLLPELGRFYEITLIVDQPSVDDPWLTANFAIHDPYWFRQHALNFDVILYQFGNSSFYHYMFKLLEDYPGIVVLHDFSLSGIIHWIQTQQNKKHIFHHSLYTSHGFSALVDGKNRGTEKTVQHYPCNLTILQRATGIIVHSQHALDLAQQWYPLQHPACIQHIPLLSIKLPLINKIAARKKLGLLEHDFLVCSFGILASEKLSHRICSTWIHSLLAKIPHCYLVLVGEVLSKEYEHTLITQIKKASLQNRIKITDFVSREQWATYLSAADVAIQLRTHSRGETSSCLIQCLSAGIPSIVNSHGSFKAIPHSIVCKINEHFTDLELAAAIMDLYYHPQMQQQLRQNALNYIDDHHHPAKIGEAYQKTIEYFTQNHPLSREKQFLLHLAQNNAADLINQETLLTTIAHIATNRTPSIRQKQLLIDISIFMKQTIKTGIQRVIQNILFSLLVHPPHGFRTEPIFHNEQGEYFYARCFTSKFLKLETSALKESPVEIYSSDIYLNLEWSNLFDPAQITLKSWHHTGVKLYFILHDLLPILYPHFFYAQVSSEFAIWLKAITPLADGIICVSQSITKDLLHWLNTANIPRLTPLKIGTFHLGADITHQPFSLDQNICQTIAQNISFLLVGTIEPRKGHGQVIQAFNQLWHQGFNANLVIVGKEGWMVEKTMKCILNHPEYLKRLLWFSEASDPVLETLYSSATALIAASEAEGFGLPLIEAAHYQLPVIARDLPVFREIMGDHAFYFKGLDPATLASVIEEWLRLHAKNIEPKTKNMSCLTWQQSTQKLLNVILNHQWLTEYPSPNHDYDFKRIMAAPDRTLDLQAVES